MHLGVLVAVAVCGPGDYPRPMPGPPQQWVAPTVQQGPVIDWARDLVDTMAKVRAVAEDVGSVAKWTLKLIADLLEWLLENYPAIRAGAVKAGAAIDGLGWGTLAKLGGAFLLLSLLSSAIQGAAKRYAFKGA